MNVIYCRTAIASYNRIKDQIDICEKFLSSKGMVIDKVYDDDGYSGLNAERPQFQEMMNNIDNIKSITIGSPNRLSRDPVLLLELYKKLDKRNIVLYDAERQTNIIDSMNKEAISEYISGLIDDVKKDIHNKR